MILLKATLFLTPLIPLFVTPSMMFPFITGKNFAFRILVELAGIFWIGLIAAKSEYRPVNSAIFLSVLAFTFIVGLADLMGINPYNSFWSNFERMEGYVTILHLLLYFMILKSVFKTKKDWQIFFGVVLTASVLVSLYPLIADYNKNTLVFRRFTREYGAREFSTLGNPPFLAAFLLLASFIGLIITCFTQKLYLRAACFMAIIVNSAVIYLTAARGAILAGAFGALTLVIYYFFLRSGVSPAGTLKRTVLLLFVLALIVSGALLVYNHTEILEHDQTISRFVSMSESASARSRLKTWKMAWTGIKEKPLLGWGQENFAGIYTLNTIVSLREHNWLDRAHNIILEWLVNAGVLGMLAYLAIFGAAIYTLRNNMREKLLSQNETVIILTALGAYFFQNLFTFDTISTYMLFFALLAYIDNNAAFEKDNLTVREKKPDPGNSGFMPIVTLSAALLCFAVIFHYTNYKPMKQARRLISISFASPEDDSYSRLLEDLREVLALDSFGSSIVRRSMLNVSSQILNKQQLDQKGALEFIYATIDELEKDVMIYGYDLEYMKDIINFYYKISSYNRSFIDHTKQLIEKVKDINPEFKWLNMMMADINILAENYDEAFFNVKSVADMYPSDEEKQFKLVLTAIYSSRDEAAEQALKRIAKVRIAENNDLLDKRSSFLSLSEIHQLARVYTEAKRYDIALRYFQEIITAMTEQDIYFDQDISYYLPQRKTHKLAQIHLELAGIYLKLDHKEKALAEAEKAMKIAPALSGAANALIDSIYN